MWILNYVYLFFGGAFLSNAVPHLVMGVTGRKFPTPFATPPGKGESSSMTNVLWGILNFFIAFVFLDYLGVFLRESLIDVTCFWAGVVLMSIFAARHFGGVYSGNNG
jgi:hypothetical protein